MFAVHCPQHGARVLIFSSGIDRIRNTETGIEVDYRCTCGHRGTWRTGARRREPARLTIARETGAEYGVLRPIAAVAGGLA